MTAENLLVLLDEIRNLIHEHSDKDGHMDCDTQKVYLALELAKKRTAPNSVIITKNFFRRID